MLDGDKGVISFLTHFVDFFLFIICTLYSVNHISPLHFYDDLNYNNGLYLSFSVARDEQTESSIFDR